MRHIVQALSLLAVSAAGTAGWAHPGSHASSSAPPDEEALQRAEHARWLSGGKLHRCDFDAYSSSLEPIAVRAKPAADARVAGTIPADAYDEEVGADLGVDLEVLEARGGWFRVRAARPRLTGWIPGRYLGFDLQTDKAFAAPDSSAAVVVTSWDTDEGRMPLTWSAPSDCKGKWVKARFTGRDGTEREAWAAGVCDNQLTTCDGVYGEYLPYEED